MEGLLHAARSGTQCSHLGGTQRTNACAAKARSFSSPHSAVPPCGAALIPGRTITSLAGSATRATRCSSRYHSCWGHSRLPMGNVDTWSSRRQHAQRTPQAARGDQPAPISKPNLGEAGSGAAPFQPRRVLAVDYGTSSTGLAVGQAGGCTPLQALSTPRTARLSEVARQVVGVALAQRAEALLVGVPVQPGGSLVKPHTDSPMGARCRSLAHTLALMGAEHELPVMLYDESGTTRAVVKGLGYNWQDRLTKQERQTKRVDAESAAMLLRLYFGNPRMAVRVKPRVNIVRRQEQEGPGGQGEQEGTQQGAGAAERPGAEGQQGRVDDGQGASGGAAGTGGGEGSGSSSL